jgi:sugar phosphate isomerase/epimerase
MKVKFGCNQRSVELDCHMQRRVIITIILLATWGVSFGQQEALGSGKLGMVSYTYRNSFQKSVPATLDSVRSLGIINMEFSNLFGQKATDIRKWLDERGMICTSFGTSYEDVMNKTAEVAANARSLGATFVRVAWIPHEKQVPFTIEDAKKAASDFNLVGKKLKDEYGLTFCYHNHGYEFVPFEGGTLFDYLVVATVPEYVSFELDILWAFHPGANPATLLLKYPNRFKLMHVKDLKMGVKGDFSGSTDPNNDVVLGTGQIDIREVLNAATKSDIRYYYIEDESKNANRQVPESLKFLASIGLP